MSNKDLKDRIVNNPKAKERVTAKRIDHDVKKELKGFCSNPFCRYCEAKAY